MKFDTAAGRSASRRRSIRLACPRCLAGWCRLEREPLGHENRSDAYGLLRAGHALPVALRDGRGGVVVARGTLVPAGTDIGVLIRRGLWADADELDRWQRQAGAQRVATAH